ncbi:acyltransferase family protein [Ferruginibacter sp.]|uniref:acyltransferase family protein n=1 Tax=Ferruginibacter sp. TaxID=1940288 RepID=UPI00374CFF7C
MNQRFYSLDVFRGATVALMILVNNPGSWGHIYTPLEHAPWHGVTPTDLVFPFFLFAVGNAMAFVLPKLEAAGESFFWKKIIQRTVLIFLIGLFLNWFPFIKWQDGHLVGKPWAYNTADGKAAGVRIFGVLQRIAICYFLASLLAHYGKQKGAFVVSAFLLLAYWFVCVAANAADPFSFTGWFGTKIDLDILGEAHIYKGEGLSFDPEGLMSITGAVVQVVFGYLAGSYIIQKGKTPEMVNGLFVTGCVLIFTGYCWDMVFPINKKIWTSSYTVYTTGLALLILATMIYCIEFKGWKGKWSRFCDVFGKNALFIFAMSGILPRLLALIQIPAGVTADGKPNFLTPFAWFYEHACKPILPAEPRAGSLIYALCFITMMWSFAWLLDKKKIYIRV